MNCRVCRGEKTVFVHRFRPYLDYETDIWDCLDCGSRFARRQGDVYEKFHASESSVYADHMRMAEEVRKLFGMGDTGALRGRLARNPKNRFIIDSAEAGPEPGNILEMGCGRGYLTSYFIARGFPVLGVDVAPSAVEWAGEAFGDHFVQDDDPRVGEGAPYDLVYHVGTIGCVESPLEFTRRMLSLTRPGGRVLFNAPNVQSCRAQGAVWISGSLPPDLVTLFDPGIWRRFFADEADVEVAVEKSSDGEWAGLLADRLMKRLAPGRFPAKYLFRVEGGGGAPERLGTGTADRMFRRSALMMTKLSGLVAPAARPPAKFGIHVKMVKRQD